MNDFDIGQYDGRWYEIVRDKYTPFELFTGCEYADYWLNKDRNLGITNHGHRFILGWSKV